MPVLEIWKTITAGEAAYNVLMGLIDKASPGGIWGEAVDMRESRAEWAIYLEYLKAYLIDSSGNLKQGIPILFACRNWASSSDSFGGGLQTVEHEVVWHGKLKIAYGFGLFFFKGAVAENDRVKITAIYFPRGFW